MVAILGDDGIRIEVDPKCIERLGVRKSFCLYSAIHSHCDAVINSLLEEIGEDFRMRIQMRHDPNQTEGKDV